MSGVTRGTKLPSTRILNDAFPRSCALKKTENSYLKLDLISKVVQVVDVG